MQYERQEGRAPALATSLRADHSRHLFRTTGIRKSFSQACGPPARGCFVPLPAHGMGHWHTLAVSTVSSPQFQGIAECQTFVPVPVISSSPQPRATDPIFRSLRKRRCVESQVFSWSSVAGAQSLGRPLGSHVCVLGPPEPSVLVVPL